MIYLLLKARTNLGQTSHSFSPIRPIQKHRKRSHLAARVLWVFQIPSEQGSHEVAHTLPHGLEGLSSKLVHGRIPIDILMLQTATELVAETSFGESDREHEMLPVV